MATVAPAQHKVARRTPRVRPAAATKVRDVGHLAFAVLFVAGIVVHSINLGHLTLATWDESVHAVVASHLEQHPLVPTLYESTLFTNFDWTTNHIWLHIPPLGMLASALSMRMLGTTPLALRLPGLLFIAGGMVASYALGRRLFGIAAGLAGAAFVGLSPYVLLLSQGYTFGDLTDTPLLLLTPALVLGVVATYRTGRVRWIVLAGIALGLCYVAKGGLGLAPAAVPLALAAVERLFPPESGWRRLGWRPPVAFLAAAAAVMVPYVVYLDRAFPVTAARENGNWIKAFLTNYEGWGRPLDYHFTTYLYALYGSGTALLIGVSMLTLAARAVVCRSRADLVIAVWIFAIYLPLTLAVDKTVPYTFAAVPAIGIATGRTIALGLTTRTGIGPLRVPWQAATVGLLLASGVSALLAQFPGAIPIESQVQAQFTLPTLAQFFPGSSLPRLWPYVLEVLLAAGLTVLYAGLQQQYQRQSRRNESGRSADSARRRRAVVYTLTTLSLVGLAAYWGEYDREVVFRAQRGVPLDYQLGQLVAEHTPRNAIVLYQTGAPPNSNLDLKVMFWSQRDVHDAQSAVVPPVCVAVAQAGRVGAPVYMLTTRAFKGVPIASASGWTLYAPSCG